MNPVAGPYVAVEAAYRRERIRSEFDGSRRHHPVRALGRAISRVHHRLEGV
ncbi:MAG: hypothetical protein QOE19_1029 [Actinomycetota bacterium]|jgi:hypothetical protein|nr:hypothetical protein [Actinomycetota bacterium]MDQ1665891.1 hypothetical protein [Actinomycetota bacterium]MDQ1670888.1 hypothetical protein [Actinomycetota bacterium]